jgi:hypothetical protein
VIAGPSQGDPSASLRAEALKAEGSGQVIEGIITGWDTAKPVAKHGVTDFSVRLAAYDPAMADYPVAVSNVAYVQVINPTATLTATPSVTPTPTPSRTPTTSPSPTASPVATITPTRGVTALPSSTPTLVPTAASTAAATPPATAPPATNTPRAEASPTATVQPTITPGVRAIISEPVEHATVSGQVKIIGTADGPAFGSYVLEFVPGDQQVAEGWLPVEPPKTTPVTAGQLGVWRTEVLRPGIYTLRLRVVGTDGTQAVALVHVAVLASQ